MARLGHSRRLVMPACYGEIWNAASSLAATFVGKVLAGAAQNALSLWPLAQPANIATPLPAMQESFLGLSMLEMKIREVG